MEAIATPQFRAGPFGQTPVIRQPPTVSIGV